MKPITSLLVSAAWVAYLSAAGVATASAFGGLKVGGEAGYTFAMTEALAYPAAVHGAAARARFGYGFDETWGVEAALGLSWYQPYEPYTAIEGTDEEGNAVVAYSVGPALERTRIQDLSLSATYALDVYRVIPSLSLGVATARVLQTVGQVTTAIHDLSIRFDAAIDVAINDRLLLGLHYCMDTYVLDRSPFPSRHGILVRATFVWDLRNLGRKAKSR